MARFAIMPRMSLQGFQPSIFPAMNWNLHKSMKSISHDTSLIDL
jgi:hypothetical protein